MITLYKNCPTIDLHGMDRELARIEINDFIRDHYNIKTETVVIVHGIGSGILRKTTAETLRKNKFVEDYKLDSFNPGQTIVRIKKKA